LHGDPIQQREMVKVIYNPILLARYFATKCQNINVCVDENLKKYADFAWYEAR